MASPMVRSMYKSADMEEDLSITLQPLEGGISRHEGSILDSFSCPNHSLVVHNLVHLIPLYSGPASCFQGLKYFNVSFWLMIKVIFIIMPLGTNLRLGELSESQV